MSCRVTLASYFALILLYGTLTTTSAAAQIFLSSFPEASKRAPDLPPVPVQACVTRMIRSAVCRLPRSYQVIAQTGYTASLWNSRNIYVQAHRTALTTVLTHEGKEMQEIGFSCRPWASRQKGICCRGLDSLHAADLSAWDRNLGEYLSLTLMTVFPKKLLHGVLYISSLIWVELIKLDLKEYIYKLLIGAHPQAVSVPCTLLLVFHKGSHGRRRLTNANLEWSALTQTAGDEVHFVKLI